MAMNEQPKQSNLDVTASQYYFDTLKPYMKDMYMKCTTDEELGRTLEKVMNKADSCVVASEYADASEAFDQLYEAITDKTYFTGTVMQKAAEEEKKLIRGLAEKIVDFRMIVKCEQPVEKEEKKARDRIGYREGTESSPIGENEDFSTHNMESLNKCEPKGRIPNRN